MTRYLLLAAALFLAPLAAVAQGVPASVIAETTRVTATAVDNAIDANKELIEKESIEKDRAQPATSAATADRAQPKPTAPPSPSPPR